MIYFLTGITFSKIKKNRIHLNILKIKDNGFLSFFIIIEHQLPLFPHPIDDGIFPTEALKPIFKLHVQKSELNLLWNADNDTIPVRQIFRHWRETTTQNIAKSVCNEEQLCRKLHLQKSTSSATYKRFIHQGSQYRQSAVNVWGDVLHMEIHLDSRREHLWICFFFLVALPGNHDSNKHNVF